MCGVGAEGGTAGWAASRASPGTEVLTVRGHTAMGRTPCLGGPTQVKMERRRVRRRRRVLGNPRVLSRLTVPPVTQE